MLVRALTEPLAKDNLRVNCICPGIVLTQKGLLLMPSGWRGKLRVTPQVVQGGKVGIDKK